MTDPKPPAASGDLDELAAGEPDEPEPLRGTVVVPHPPRASLASAEFTVETAQPEARDPIATLRRYVDEVFRDEGVSCIQYQKTVEALDTLERDRAAHAAEVTRLKSELSAAYQHESEIETDREQLRDERDKCCGELGRVTVEHAAEVERLRGELLRANEYSGEMHDRATKAEFELAAARAERPEPSDLIDVAKRIRTSYFGATVKQYGSWESESVEEKAAWINAAKSALLGVRREGPTREAVVGAIKAAWAEHQSHAQTHDWLDCLVDAVIVLFGAEPKGQQDSGSPGSAASVAAQSAEGASKRLEEPQTVGPGDSSSDERPWNYEAPPDSEIGQTHELLSRSEGDERHAHGMRVLDYTGNGEWASGMRRLGLGGSVKAWRRAEPKGQPEPNECAHEGCIKGAGHGGLHQPAPDGFVIDPPDDLAGMPTAWRERFEALEGALAELSLEVSGRPDVDWQAGTNGRLDALERAVEGLKGGGR